MPVARTLLARHSPPQARAGAKEEEEEEKRVNQQQVLPTPAWWYPSSTRTIWRQLINKISPPLMLLPIKKVKKIWSFSTINRQHKSSKKSPRIARHLFAFNRVVAPILSLEMTMTSCYIEIILQNFLMRRRVRTTSAT